MNYQRIYNELMERAKDRRLDCYTERHHIVPRCVGGKDAPENIAVLTPEEHYVAHLLLVKINPNNHKLLWAAVAMTNGTKNSPRKNKMYGWLRQRLSERMSKKFKGKPLAEETKRKISEALRGRKNKPFSEETKAKMSAIAKGRKKSLEHCKSLSIAKLGSKRKPHSKEAKEKIRLSNIEACKNRDFTERQNPEYKKIQAEKMKEVWQKRRLGVLPPRKPRSNKLTEI